MNSSFLPKTFRAEILAIFRLFFGKNDGFIKVFWDLLTFRRLTLFSILVVSNISNSRSVYRHISIYKNVLVSPILFFMCQYVKRYRYSHFFQQHLRRHLFFQGLKVIFLSASVWRRRATLEKKMKLCSKSWKFSKSKQILAGNGGYNSFIARIKRYQRGVNPLSSTQKLLLSEREKCILEGSIEKRNRA